MFKRNFSIEIKKNAWKQLHNIFSQTKNKTFLFSANSGGCSGLNYSLAPLRSEIKTELLTSKIPPTILKNSPISVYIDPLSEMYLHGTHIDYLFQDFEKNIYESKFVFIPDKNIAGTCGCGISFYIK